MVVESDFVGSCAEVAVMFADVVAGTVGGVYRPDEEMDPALAVHFTLELNFPEPTTVAEH